MADLVTVIRKSDGEELVVDIETAQKMLDRDELTIPANTGNALTIENVMGSDYDQSDLVSRI